jgi:hypothetical protein
MEVMALGGARWHGGGGGRRPGGGTCVCGVSVCWHVCVVAWWVVWCMLCVADKGAGSAFAVGQDPRLPAKPMSGPTCRRRDGGLGAPHTFIESQVKLGEDPERAPRVSRYLMGGCNGNFF